MIIYKNTTKNSKRVLFNGKFYVVPGNYYLDDKLNIDVIPRVEIKVDDYVEEKTENILEEIVTEDLGKDIRNIASSKKRNTKG